MDTPESGFLGRSYFSLGNPDLCTNVRENGLEKAILFVGGLSQEDRYLSETSGKISVVPVWKPDVYPTFTV